jgi:hypothetical protein
MLVVEAVALAFLEYVTTASKDYGYAECEY